MAPSRPSSSISRPFALRKKEPTLAAVSSVVATGSRAERSQADTSGSLRAASLLQKTTKRDGKPTWSLATASSRKRGRQESSDENTDSCVDRKPRIRQRLVSKASVETIRELKSSRQAAEAAAPRSQSSKPSLSRQSSTRTLRGEDSTAPKPLARSLSVNMNSPAPRALRRVGTVSFSKLDRQAILGAAKDIISTPSSSQISSSSHRSLATGSTGVDSAPPVQRVLRRSKSHINLTQPQTTAECMAALIPSQGSYDLTDAYTTDGYYLTERNPVRPMQLGDLPNRPSTREELNRFDLNLSLYEKHVELWDKPKNYTYGWQGVLLLTDKQVTASTLPNMPYTELRIDCRTHAYDGPFSGENNELPAFATGFGGTTVERGGITLMLDHIDQADGIVVEQGWRQNREVTSARERQWYVRFWVPIPMTLFKRVEMRMFKVKAMASVTDDKTCRRTVIYSGVEIGDISHLRKQRNMDHAVPVSPDVKDCTRGSP